MIKLLVAYNVEPNFVRTNDPPALGRDALSQLHMPDKKRGQKASL